MTVTRRSPIFWVVPIAAASIGAVVLLLALANPMMLAAVSAEQRPASLRDAQWNDPSSARRFGMRFPSGTPEHELTRWLTKAGFTVEAPGRASKVISSFPCNEFVAVTWVSGPKGLIAKTSVEVSEAGCL